MASQIKGLTDCDETYEAAVSTNATPTCGAPSDTSAPPRLQLIVCCGSILVYFGLFWSIFRRPCGSFSSGFSRSRGTLLAFLKSHQPTSSAGS